MIIAAYLPAQPHWYRLVRVDDAEGKADFFSEPIIAWSIDPAGVFRAVTIKGSQQPGAIMRPDESVFDGSVDFPDFATYLAAVREAEAADPNSGAPFGVPVEFETSVVTPAGLVAGAEANLNAKPPLLVP